MKIVARVPGDRGAPRKPSGGVPGRTHALEATSPLHFFRRSLGAGLADPSFFCGALIWWPHQDGGQSGLRRMETETVLPLVGAALLIVMVVVGVVVVVLRPSDLPKR